ncbi:tryptophan-rich sensory protein [bacterium]|nr:tryptophan-rich sensory protein [bacterium]
MYIDYSWYSELIQPVLKPPAWLFAPVWTILYISMGVALFLYAKKASLKSKSWGYLLFFTQLLVNLSWSPAFFGLKNIYLALALIMLLDVLVLFNIIEFFKISKSAGRCLIPYFLWLLFATYLNLGIVILN